MPAHINYRRIGSCNRCGQCCKNIWPEEWPETLFWHTQEWLEQQYPVIALLGIPDPEHLSSEVEIDSYTIKCCWYKGVRKDKDSPDCPFLVYERDSDLYSCVLYHTRHEFWERNCGIYPNKIMSLPEAETYLRDYPKCSYRWIPEEDIANQIK